MSLLTGLSAHWSLDEVSGTRLDSTSNNHDLADNNTVLYEAGRVGRAALFDASASEYLSVSDHADLSLESSSFTIMFWAKVTDRATVPLIAKTTALGITSSTEYLIYHKRFSGNSWWGMVSGGNGGAVETNTSVNQNYYFGCFVHDNSIAFPEDNVRFYGDMDSDSIYGRSLNTRSGSMQSGWIGSGSAPLRLGTSNGSGEFLEGGLDEVAIWKRALSDGEVRSLWNFGDGLAYPWSESEGGDLDWQSTGSLETLHRRHRTPDRTHPVFVKYDYSWSGFLNDKFLDVPDITDWGSPPEVPVLPLEHRRAPYRAYSQEDRNIYPDVSDWWLQASEPVMPRKGTGEKAYWESGMDRDSASGEPSIPTTNPGVSSPSSATGGGDDTVVPPTAEPSIDGKTGLYIPERPDVEDTLRPRVDDPE